jgi:hypothetical protein
MVSEFQRKQRKHPGPAVAGDCSARKLPHAFEPEALEELALEELALLLPDDGFIAVFGGAAVSRSIVRVQISLYETVSRPTSTPFEGVDVQEIVVR